MQDYIEAELGAGTIELLRKIKDTMDPQNIMVGRGLGAHLLGEELTRQPVILRTRGSFCLIVEEAMHTTRYSLSVTYPSAVQLDSLGVNVESSAEREEPRQLLNVDKEPAVGRLLVWTYVS